MRLALALFCVAAFAQELPLIRGTVMEFGTTPPSPIVGAQVTLYEFAPVDGVINRLGIAKAFTDGKGVFSIKPDRPGNYFIDATKPTYLTAEDLDAFNPLPCCFMAEGSLTIERGGTLEPFDFILVRPGALSGRVVDEKDKPVANLTLSSMGLGRSLIATTDAEGNYTFARILPGPTKIHVGPASRAGMPLARFTKADTEVVEEDIETSYWPGGVSDPTLALPITVLPGVTLNMTTIRTRKAPYYRALVHYEYGCERPRFIGFTDGASYMPGLCEKDLLIGKVAVGTRTLAAWEPVSTSSDILSWALIPLAIQDHNIEVTVAMTPSVDVRGRFIARNSDQAPDVGASRISLKPLDVSFNRTFDAQTREAAFAIKRVAWPRHKVTVTLGNPNLVVKEMRYGGQPVNDGVIYLVPSATLDVIVDAR